MLKQEPILNEIIDIDSSQIDYYKSLESTLSFWLDDQNDNIFKNFYS